MQGRVEPNISGISAVDTTPLAMVYTSDRDSEGVIRQALGDLGIPNTAFGVEGIKGAISDLSKKPSPRLLIVDISGVDEPTAQINQLADVCEPGTGLIVIGDRNDIILYRELKNAGIVEYFFKPLSGALVSRACNAVLTGNLEQHALRTGRLIFALGARGGCGATTIGVRLAWHLAQTRKRLVAFLDLDLQTGDSALQFDVTPHHALREALEHPERIDELFLERGVVRVTERLDLLASEEPLDFLPSYAEDALLTLLEKLRHNYRYVFVDVPVAHASLMQRVLHLPSLCLLVSDGSLVSARDVARWRLFLGPNSAERSTIHILNKAGAPGSLPIEEFNRAVGKPPDIIVPYDKDVAAATNLGVRRLEECHAFMRALRPVLRDISGEPTEDERTLLDRIIGR